MKKCILYCVLLLSIMLAGCQIPAGPGPDQSPGHYEGLAGSAGKAYDQSGDQIGGWLKVGEIVASVLCPEYALIVAAVGAGYGALKSKKLIVSDKKYRAHRQGVDAFMNSGDTTSNQASELYDKIGKARTANNV